MKQQKIFELIVDLKEQKEEALKSKNELNALLEKGWRIKLQTPVLESEHVGWGAVETYTNRIIYTLEKED